VWVPNGGAASLLAFLDSTPLLTRAGVQTIVAVPGSAAPPAPPPEEGVAPLAAALASVSLSEGDGAAPRTGGGGGGRRAAAADDAYGVGAAAQGTAGRLTRWVQAVHDFTVVGGAAAGEGGARSRSLQVMVLLPRRGLAELVATFDLTCVQVLATPGGGGGFSLGGPGVGDALARRAAWGARAAAELAALPLPAAREFVRTLIRGAKYALRGFDVDFGGWLRAWRGWAAAQGCEGGGVDGPLPLAAPRSFAQAHALAAVVGDALAAGGGGAAGNAAAAAALAAAAGLGSAEALARAALGAGAPHAALALALTIACGSSRCEGAARALLAGGVMPRSPLPPSLARASSAGGGNATPLHRALAAGLPELAAALAAAGAVTGADVAPGALVKGARRGGGALPPLAAAAQLRGAPAGVVVAALLAAGAAVDEPDAPHGGFSALLHAARCGSLVAVNALLEGGADPRAWAGAPTSSLVCYKCKSTRVAALAARETDCGLQTLSCARCGAQWPFLLSSTDEANMDVLLRVAIGVRGGACTEESLAPFLGVAEEEGGGGGGDEGGAAAAAAAAVAALRARAAPPSPRARADDDADAAERHSIVLALLGAGAKCCGLAEHGAPPAAAAGTGGPTALHAAAARGMGDTVAALLRSWFPSEAAREAYANAPDASGATALDLLESVARARGAAVGGGGGGAVATLAALGAAPVPPRDLPLFSALMSGAELRAQAPRAEDGAGARFAAWHRDAAARGELPWEEEDACGDPLPHLHPLLAGIYKVLNQIHPETGLSLRGATAIAEMMEDVLERLATTAADFAENQQRLTLSTRHLIAAVRLCLPGEIAKHAVSELCKAVTKASCTEQRELCPAQGSGLVFPVACVFAKGEAVAFGLHHALAPPRPLRPHLYTPPKERALSSPHNCVTLATKTGGWGGACARSPARLGAAPAPAFTCSPALGR
jgi:hypothetical protein